MKPFAETSTIIHAFALLHAGTSVLLLSRGSSDEALLTLLTMTMIVLLCHQRRVSIQFTILCVAIGNIIGYFFGLTGADILRGWKLPDPLANTIATFVTTELIGWILYFISDILNNLTRERDLHTDISPLWLLVVLLAIFSIRLMLIDTFDGDLNSVIDITDMTMRFLTNSLAMLIMLCGDILVINALLRKGSPMSSLARSTVILASTVAFALLGATMVAFNFPFGDTGGVSTREVFRYFVVGLVIQTLLVVLVVLADGSIKARRIARDERSKAHLAQYKYLKLKQQVDPHFLFNNLNILDYLVTEGENEKASTFIHKLAGIYRYMIRNEEESTVSLSDEMNFVGHYIELMQVRFPEGLIISVDIPEEDMRRSVIPCSVQLLIENATKHNIISAGEPLRISISSDGTRITVANSLNLKESSSRHASTGLGLKYIREQYEDIAGGRVQIDSHSTLDGRDAYQVSIPLL